MVAAVTLRSMRNENDEIYEASRPHWNWDVTQPIPEIVFFYVRETEKHIVASRLPRIRLESASRVRFIGKAKNRLVLHFNEPTQRVSSYRVGEERPFYSWENVEHFVGVYGNFVFLTYQRECEDPVVVVYEYDMSGEFDEVAQICVPDDFARMHVFYGDECAKKKIHITGRGRFVHFTVRAESWRVDTWERTLFVQETVLAHLPLPLAHLVSSYAEWSTMPAPAS